MGKYAGRAFEKPSNQVKETNPLWRGIGCLLFVVVPFFSFGLGALTLDFAHQNGWPLPAELFTTPAVPPILYLSPVLAQLVAPVFGIQGLYGYILFTLVYSLVVGSIVSIIYSFIYRFVGPSRYGPTDVPPDGRKVKKYNR